MYDTITMDGINGQKQQVRILVFLFLLELECSILGFIISLFLDPKGIYLTSYHTNSSK